MTATKLAIAPVVSLPGTASRGCALEVNYYKLLHCFSLVSQFVSVNIVTKRIGHSEGCSRHVLSKLFKLQIICVCIKDLNSVRAAPMSTVAETRTLATTCPVQQSRVNPWHLAASTQVERRQEKQVDHRGCLSVTLNPSIVVTTSLLSRRHHERRCMRTKHTMECARAAA